MRMLSAEVRRLLRGQYGVISRAQCLRAGLTPDQVRSLLLAGQWERIHDGVYRLAGTPIAVEAEILAACLAAGPGAVASHHSAAWMWRLVDAGDRRYPVISVRRSAHPRVHGVTVHRVRDLNSAGRVMWRQVPCTNPLRTLVDLAGAVPETTLDGAVDRGIARRLLTVDGLVAEIDRLSRPGRPGVRPLRDALRRRGHIGGPAPSVLESRTLRLLYAYGIRPIGSEIKVDGGRYRLDIGLSEHVAIEVDGYRYHSDPDALGRDSQRGNHLLLARRYVLHYTWLHVLHDQPRIIREVRQALVDFS